MLLNHSVLSSSHLYGVNNSSNLWVEVLIVKTLEACLENVSAQHILSINS